MTPQYLSVSIFPACRQTKLSRLCLPTTGMEFQGDRTMAGAETRKSSPLISQNKLSAHTPTHCCKYTRLLGNGGPDWSVEADAVFNCEGGE